MDRLFKWVLNPLHDYIYANKPSERYDEVLILNLNQTLHRSCSVDSSTPIEHESHISPVPQVPLVGTGQPDLTIVTLQEPNNKKPVCN